MDMKTSKNHKTVCCNCEFFTPVGDKGTCGNEASVYNQIEVSKHNRCWRGAAK